MRHFIEPNSFSLEEQLALLDLAAPAVIQFVRQLSAGVGIPANLAQLNKVDPADFAALAELALHDTCMSTNQITPTRDEVVAVYTAAFRG